MDTTETTSASNSEFARYSRQMRYAPIGIEGQRKLKASRVLLCGCGALGSVLAGTLARAGVGYLRIVDRDFLELSNLQRQVLYTEEDVAAGLPKAIAAQQHLSKINSSITIDAHVADVSSRNMRQLCEGVDLILDGTDNFETRFLLNDASFALGIPWVYGGCIGAEGQSLTIIPGKTPCLRCIMGEPPPPGTSPTCDTSGILATIIQVVASIQATEALKILTGHEEAINRCWTVIDLWENVTRQLKLDSFLGNTECPTCNKQAFPWLEGERGSQAAILCGRNSVQLNFPSPQPLSLEQLEASLASVGTVTRNRYLLRLAVGEYLITIFPDGRAVIGGTEDIAQARSIYARYIGN